MATKKTPTTKKAQTTKKTTAKGTAKARPLTWKFYVVAIGIFLISVSTVVVIGVLTSSAVATREISERYDRIQGIYKSLAIDELDYHMQTANIFGDKRVYEWGKGRTYSSEITYIHGDTVSSTATELDTKIKAAGFTFIDEPYEGGAQIQYHYKSDKGEYIRLSVESKSRMDAIQNAYWANNKQVPDSVYDMDTNAGPSNVTIKVNLDDNNE